MKAVWIKAVADLWGRRWQSLLIAMTIAAASALLYLGLLTLGASTEPFEKLLERTQGPHAYFIISGDGADALATRLAADADVTDIQLRRIRPTELLLPGRDENADVFVQPSPPGYAGPMGHVIVAGNDLRAGGQDEAVLGVSTARYFGIKVGDQVRLALAEGPKSLTVVGLSADSLWCPYPNCSTANLYTLPETFSGLAEAADEPTHLLGARLTDPSKADEFTSRVVKEAGLTKITLAVSWLTMRLGTQLMQAFSTVSLLMFAVTAIAAAALITVNLVGGAVLAQFREIAVLKVLGFTARQVMLLFAGQNLLLGLAGAGLGVGAGGLAARRMLVPMAENMGDPTVLNFQPELAGVVVAVIAGVAILVSLVAAWPAVVLRPTAALRDGFATPRSRVPLAVRLLSWMRLPAPVVLGVKDVTARPGRAALTVAGLTLCTITITMGAAVGQFTQQINADLDLMGMPYDIMVNPKAPYTADQAEALARSVAGVESVARATQLGVMATEQAVSFRLEALAGDWARLPWQVVRGRLVEGPDEIVLATGAMRKLKVSVGDRLTLQVGGQNVTWRVVGEYRNPMELGQVGITTIETLRQVLPEAKAEGLKIRVKRGIDPGDVRQALLEQSNYRISAALMRTFIAGGFVADLLKQVRVLATLMVIIAAISMMNTALLTAREQVREAGIRKAMGMTPGQILASVGAGGAWLGLIGAGLGVPVALVMHELMSTALTEQGIFGKIPLEMPPIQIGLLVAGATALAVLAAMPAAAWAGRIVTAQALRAE
ncbi:MAG: transporter permease [Symbiobacteriaceae bacterium]|jgi:putative ABC transport system permease protein|nr:transporter permease [Symbiobacteriaceae bacterium]